MAKIKKGDVLLSRRTLVRRRVKSFTKLNGRRAARLERIGPQLTRGNSRTVTVTTLDSLVKNYELA